MIKKLKRTTTKPVVKSTIKISRLINLKKKGAVKYTNLPKGMTKKRKRAVTEDLSEEYIPKPTPIDPINCIVYVLTPINQANVLAYIFVELEQKKINSNRATYMTTTRTSIFCRLNKCTILSDY